MKYSEKKKKKEGKNTADFNERYINLKNICLFISLPHTILV